MSAFLFVTDLDNTLIGDDLALAMLNQQLSEHRQEHGTKIVYATGRSRIRYQQLTEEKSLLTPDALITSVGTEIYFDPHQYNFDSEWANLLADAWDQEQVTIIASHFADLVLQPLSEQNPFKVSYYLSPQVAPEVLPLLESSLAESGLKTKLIYSGSRDLDILPHRGDKGLAVKFLRQKWDFDFYRTVVCGDSGNDIALFGMGQERGIIVSNAQTELLQWYEFNQTAYRYLAQSAFAGGILEGLKYFGFL